MPKRQKDDSLADVVVTAALEELGGGAVVLLDRELRVVFASPAATALLGDIPLGALAPKLLCGGARKRPIAEAMAAGRPVSGTIARPRGPADELIHVSAIPVERAETRVGWALLFAPGHDGDAGPECFHGMWSEDAGMKRMFRFVERVARTETTVLVRGETGSGKELVANALHAASRRSKGPFRAINCAAVPGPLLESELFGHARGAFTGAVRDAPGHFKLAHGGTLFLDEVAELSLDLQAKLLRVLETHTVTPVGGREAIPVDVRIISATHRALRKEAEAGRFRTDLMYRIRVIPIFIPPLRARGGDVELLALRAVEDMNRRSERQIVRIAPAARAALLRYPWPGNVRELRNVLEYAYAIGDGPVLLESDLPAEILSASGQDEDELLVNAPAPADASRDLSPEARAVVHALERASGSRARAAKRARGLCQRGRAAG